MQPVLEFRDFSKTYKGGKRAVDGLSLAVNPGDILGFIGPNGAGKSTSIKAAMGVLRFEGGEIFIDGMSVKERPVECKRITAFLPDNPDLYENLTGIKYLNFIADIFSVPSDARNGAIKHYTELFGIEGALANPVSSYSHGMKQKLALCAALLHSPKLLVLDEPFVGLDPEAALKLKNIMREMCAAGCAVFFSTHVLDVAQNLCNRVAIIKEGRLVASGDMAEVVRGRTLEQVFMEVAAGER